MISDRAFRIIVALLTLLILFGLFGIYQTITLSRSFVEECNAKGGVAVLGHTTNLCLKPGSVLP